MINDNLREVGIYNTLTLYKNSEKRTLGDLLKEMRLDAKYYAILCDGRPKKPEDIIESI